MDVLISGASIAGPALAYWLGRYGFRPTVVEIAPALRTGGNAVDFRGPLHLGLLRRMGVLEDLRKVQTGGTAMRFVDAAGTAARWRCRPTSPAVTSRCCAATCPGCCARRPASRPSTCSATASPP